ncbi:MAG: tetratricopeptide repeat protein, partial [Flavobacteriales bacterium]
IRLEESSASFYRNRGNIYLENNKINNAKIDLLKSIELNPNNPEGYYYLGLLSLNQYNYTESLSFLNNAIIKHEEGVNENIHSVSEKSEINLKDIYIARGDVFRNFIVEELMCDDYKNACNLGDCEMFEKYCK